MTPLEIAPACIDCVNAYWGSLPFGIYPLKHLLMTVLLLLDQVVPPFGKTTQSLLGLLEPSLRKRG